MKNLWWFLTMAAVVWYSFVTAYVAYKGIGDIKGMLQRLKSKREKEEEA